VSLGIIGRFTFVSGLLWSSSVLADQSVTFTAPDQVFAIVPTATGTVRENGVFLTVSLDRFTLRASDKFKQSVRVLGYRVGLVKSTGSGAWEIIRSSSTVAANFSVSPNQTQTMAGHQAEIPIDGLGSIRGDWLVIAVDVQGEGPAGVVYAHSQNWNAP
jgi:hypothetical protein